NFGTAELRTGIKLSVKLTDRLPINGKLIEEFEVQPGVPFVTMQGIHDGIHVGLRSEPGERRDSEIDYVDTGFGRFDHGSTGDATGIVGVEMHRNPDLGP